MPVPLRRRTLYLMAAVALWATACRQDGVPAGGVDDSTYMRAMALLRRRQDDRIGNPLPPLPTPIGPRGAPATPQQLRHRDSLQEVRRDSMKRSDSVTRASILAGLKVTPEQLLATARSLGRDPMKAQRMSDAIGRKVSALDSASRKARADSIERAKKAAGTATSAARSMAGGAKPKP